MNNNHGPDGRFTSGAGAANGDPSKEAAATRNVPGAGHVPRSQVVTLHAGQDSVADSGAGFSRLSSAARDAIIRQKATDQRHFPVRGPESTAAIDLGMPAGSRTAPGKLDPRINDRARAILKRNRGA